MNIKAIVHVKTGKYRVVFRNLETTASKYVLLLREMSFIWSIENNHSNSVLITVLLAEIFTQLSLLVVFHITYYSYLAVRIKIRR